MLNSIVDLMYFRLHLHKLCRLITCRALVSETTHITSCDSPTSPKLLFSLFTFVTYVGHMEFETHSGYPGNCNQVPSS